MKQLIFSTGNDDKFQTAEHVASAHGVKLIQKDADVTEIQSEDPEKVALDKAAKAFAMLKEPVAISDDSWAFLGLGGFPGVYMHSINHWFTPEDFLHLVLPLKDRRVIFTQYLIYTDAHQQKVFTRQTSGTLLKEIRGTSVHASHTVVALDRDDGLSIAEAYHSADKSSRLAAKIWHDFLGWYDEQ